MMKFMNVLKKSKNKKGFTLTELIVVITILGILSVVVAPSVIGYIADTKTNVDNTNAKMLENLIQRGLSDGGLDATIALTDANVEAYLLSELPSGALPEVQQGVLYTFYVSTAAGSGHVQCATIASAPANYVAIN